MAKITCEDAVRALKAHGLSSTAACIAQFLPGADSRSVATALRKATRDGRVNIRYTKKRHCLLPLCAPHSEDRAMTGWKSLKWLPNTHGYPFTGKLRDGSTVRCRVVRGEDGRHTVSGAAWADLMGWRE